MLAALLTGCIGRGPVLPPLATAPDERIELAATPFHPQEEYHCGPAALATVLEQAGVPVAPEQLVEQVYLPSRRGSLQVELLAATRRHGRLAYLLPHGLPSLLQELRAERPVLVLQNLGLKTLPRWHYAVVVGFDAARDGFILRSGTERRKRLSASRFVRSWERAGAWAFVVLDPDELPAALEPHSLLRSIVALEPLAAPRVMEQAYRNYLARVAREPVALLGLGNALLAQRRPAAAERIYRQLLRDRPAHVAAHNNLALALVAQACHEEAEQHLQEAWLGPPEMVAQYRPALVDTRQQLAAARRTPSAQCRSR